MAGPSDAEASSAMSKVMSTPELVDNILSQLPLRDIYAAASVSQLFKAVTKTGLTARRAFRTPEPVVVMPSNELHEQEICCCTSRLHTAAACGLRLQDAQGVIVHTLNPLLTLGRQGCGYEYMPCREPALQSCLDFLVRFTMAEFTSTASSWRNMFVTQPPTRALLIVDKVILVEQRGEVIKPRGFSYRIENPSGVTLNDLYNHAVRMANIVHQDHILYGGDPDAELDIDVSFGDSRSLKIVQPYDHRGTAVHSLRRAYEEPLLDPYELLSVVICEDNEDQNFWRPAKELSRGFYPRTPLESFMDDLSNDL